MILLFLPLPLLLSFRLLYLLFHLLVILRLVPLPNTQSSICSQSPHIRHAGTLRQTYPPADQPHLPDHYFSPGTQAAPSRHSSMMAFRRSDGQSSHIATRTYFVFGGLIVSVTGVDVA